MMETKTVEEKEIITAALNRVFGASEQGDDDVGPFVILCTKCGKCGTVEDFVMMRPGRLLSCPDCGMELARMFNEETATLGFYTKEKGDRDWSPLVGTEQQQLMAMEAKEILEVGAAGLHQSDADKVGAVPLHKTGGKQ